jgi:hypothetical protein
MEKKKIICLFLFVVLILVSSSCHSRNISDIKPAMTKEKVVSLWGPTGISFCFLSFYLLDHFCSR